MEYLWRGLVVPSVVFAVAVTLRFAVGIPETALFVVAILLVAGGARSLRQALTWSRALAGSQVLEIAMQQRLEEVVARAPGVICSLAPARDGAPAVTYAGPGMDAMFGVSQGPGIFRLDLLVGSTDVRDAGPLRSSFRQATSECGPWRHEFRINHPQRGMRWISASAAYDGSLAEGPRWHAHLEDITERLMADDEQRYGAARAAVPETVLVCEDEPGVLLLIERLLADHGYEVIATGDPLQALRIVEELGTPIDLLVSDVVLPGMLGPELADRLRARFSELPILFISGYSAGAIRSRASLPRASGFLEKPFAVAELVREIRRLLDESALKGLGDPPQEG
jgi:CheY-like chemotaxis protein